MSFSYEAFLSYAGEDSKFATELVGGLKTRGLRIWYAPLNLKVGDKLLDSIEEGMRISSSGILLISRDYLNKGWTNYEMDTLIRQNIEKSKKIYPIWYKVTKDEVEAKHVGLGGIVALQVDSGLNNIVTKITSELALNAPTISFVPSYESPKFKFLQGRGEIQLGSSNGPATTLWEFLLYAKEQEYPLYLEGELFSKFDLLIQAAQLLPNIPDIVRNWVGEEGRVAIWNKCKEIGLDPDIYA